MGEPTPILVAIMYSTIISISLGTLLNFFAVHIGNGRLAGLPLVYLSWTGLLTLLHMLLFWETAGIMQREDWQFGDFLLVITGPVILFLATSLLAAAETTSENPLGDQQRRFFLSLSALCLWLALVDLITIGLSAVLVLDLLVLAIFVSLAYSKAGPWRALSSLLIWAILLTPFI